MILKWLYFLKEVTVRKSECTNRKKRKNPFESTNKNFFVFFHRYKSKNPKCDYRHYIEVLYMAQNYWKIIFLWLPNKKKSREIDFFKFGN